MFKYHLQSEDSEIPVWEREVATIFRSYDDGPVRFIVNGRHTKPTGFFQSVKAGYRQLPYESLKAELPTFWAAEAASGVSRFIAQPFRLEMRVQGQREPLVFLPDIELTADTAFIDDLLNGVSFATAAATPRSFKQNDRRERKVVIEIKDDKDPRNNDPAYQHKLALAKSIFSDIGIHFQTIMRSTDLNPLIIDNFRQVALSKRTSLCSADIDAAVKFLRSKGGSCNFGQLCLALGGGSRARKRVLALHIQRALSVDLRETLDVRNVVHLMK